MAWKRTRGDQRRRMLLRAVTEEAVEPELEHDGHGGRRFLSRPETD